MAFEMNGLRVTVIGAAKSGLAAAQLAKKKGAHVFVTEFAPEEKKSSEKVLLQSEHIEHEFGGHSDRALECDIAVISPGVPSEIPLTEKLKSRGIKILSEIELASCYLKGKTIAITGSNGKTTTTTWIGEIMKAAGKNTIVAGNIGTPLSDCIDQSREDGINVLEVSSFQAEGVELFKPNIAVITNLSPDHMDRYSSVDAYYRAKMNMIKNQTSKDILIYNGDDETLRSLVKNHIAEKYEFSRKVIPEIGGYIENGNLMYRYGRHFETITSVSELGIPGKHNIENALATMLAAKTAGIETGVVQKVLREFKGVEHRLEFVTEKNGVRFYNDSKATNVDSARVALESFEGKKIWWIAGGKHKGSPYTPLAEIVTARVKGIILIGEAASIIESDLGRLTSTKKATSMNEAVQIAAKESSPGDVVLLSPACASYDMFKNYEHRGGEFKRCVHEL